MDVAHDQVGQVLLRHLKDCDPGIRFDDFVSASAERQTQDSFGGRDPAQRTPRQGSFGRRRGHGSVHLLAEGAGHKMEIDRTDAGAKVLGTG